MGTRFPPTGLSSRKGPECLAEPCGVCPFHSAGLHSPEVTAGTEDSVRAASDVPGRRGGGAVHPGVRGMCGFLALPLPVHRPPAWPFPFAACICMFDSVLHKACVTRGHGVPFRVHSSAGAVAQG